MFGNIQSPFLNSIQSPFSNYSVSFSQLFSLIFSIIGLIVADDFSVNKIFTTSGVLFALIRKLRKLIFRKKNCRLQFACQPWTCTVSCMLTRGSFLRATISALNYELFPWIEYMYYFLLQLGKEIYNVDIHSYFPLTRLNYTLNAF